MIERKEWKAKKTGGMKNKYKIRLFKSSTEVRTVSLSYHTALSSYGFLWPGVVFFLYV